MFLIRDVMTHSVSNLCFMLRILDRRDDWDRCRNPHNQLKLLWKPMGLKFREILHFNWYRISSPLTACVYIYISIHTSNLKSMTARCVKTLLKQWDSCTANEESRVRAKSWMIDIWSNPLIKKCYSTHVAFSGMYVSDRISHSTQEDVSDSVIQKTLRLNSWPIS